LCAAYNKQYSTDYLSAMPTNLYGPGDPLRPAERRHARR
jgi:GDP-L-fucose synthase